MRTITRVRALQMTPLVIDGVNYAAVNEVRAAAGPTVRVFGLPD